jgi:long-chain-acyl-CoA dehydrogenase
MRRDIFTADHEAFQDVVRSFIKREVEPHHEQWERADVVSREVWLAARCGWPQAVPACWA